MVTINKLYKVQIDCSTYEPQIDSTNTNITITVKDFNNQPIQGAIIPVSVDKGYFTQVTQGVANPNNYPIIAQTLDFEWNSNTELLIYGDFVESQQLMLRIIGGTFITDDHTVTYNEQNSSTISYTIYNPKNLDPNTEFRVVIELLPYVDNTNHYYYEGDVLIKDKDSSSKIHNTYSIISSLGNVTSYNGITNKDGVFTLKYTANDWNFVNIQAGNNNVKLYVSGWRTISLRLGTEYDYWSKTTNGVREYKGSTTSGAINPLKNISMKHDDSIGFIQYSFGYNNSWNTNLKADSSNYPFKLFTDSENANSRIPSYLITELPRPLGHRWYRPDLLYFIKSNGEFIMRPYNEDTNSHVVSPDPADNEKLNIEKMYWSEVVEL